MTSSETTASAATDLPVPLTRFIGRDRELEALAILLDETRLLTLTGAGGSGKTRLAREAVRHAADRFERVAWADLTALADPALLGERLAAGSPCRAAGAAAASASRPGARTPTAGHASNSASAAVAHASTRCSQLSSTWWRRVRPPPKRCCSRAPRWSSSPRAARRS